jgi:Zn-dependent protease
MNLFIETLKTDPPYFFAVVITVVVSICLHELSHGVVAIRLGDRTPIETGHMTLNPAVHMGVFSIITLLIAGIAWGAMPISPHRVRAKYGEALIALAGPVCNVILGMLALTALGLWWRFGEAMDRGTPAGNLQYLLQVFGIVNLNLALFNLIPIPPLDGSKILENMSSWYATIAEHLRMSGSSMILFVVAFSAVGKVTGPAALRIAVEWLGWLVTVGR